MPKRFRQVITDAGGSSYAYRGGNFAFHVLYSLSAHAEFGGTPGAKIRYLGLRCVREKPCQGRLSQ